MGGESLEAAWLTTSEKDSGSKWLLGRAQQLDFHFLSHYRYIKAIMLYKGIFLHTLAYSGILWHTLAYSGILWHTLAYSGIL